MSLWQGSTLIPVQKYGRRNFLKTGLQLGTGLTASSVLAGCAAFDRIILGGGPRDPLEVTILGAGLAGLTTAYLCKKNGIPFSLYEGSSRVGGRVLTLREFNSASQAADLGGEWISSKHEAILKLAKELAVEVVALKSETSNSEYAFFENNKRHNSNELQKELRSFQKKANGLYLELFGRGGHRLNIHTQDELPRALAQDAMSCEELIQKYASKSSKTLHYFLRRQILLTYGAESSEVSSLQWLISLVEQTDFNLTNANSMMRVSGGTGVLTQALFDRVAGVISGRFVKTSHRLVSVSEDSSGFELYFETPQGQRTVSSKRVVSTLPMSVFRQIAGVKKVSFQDSVHQVIEQAKVGAQAKGVLGFADRPWKKQLGLRQFSGDFESQSFWETEPRGQSHYQRDEFDPHCLLVFQLGGPAAVSAGPHSIERAEKDLMALKLNSGNENLSQIHGWSQSPWSAGGRSYFSPQQTAELAGALVAPQCSNKWFFAGEAASLQWPGTMNGAVESAFNAFQQLTKADAKVTGS